MHPHRNNKKTIQPFPSLCSSPPSFCWHFFSSSYLLLLPESQNKMGKEAKINSIMVDKKKAFQPLFELSYCGILFIFLLNTDHKVCGISDSFSHSSWELINFYFFLWILKPIWSYFELILEVHLLIVSGCQNKRCLRMVPLLSSKLTFNEPLWLECLSPSFWASGLHFFPVLAFANLPWQLII